MAVACSALFGPDNLEFPIRGITLECLITEVKEKMPEAPLNLANLNPIIWALRKPQIALHLVELSPLWRLLTESALSPIPTLIIGGPQTVSLAGEESQPADILGAELRKLEGIHQERNDYISTIDCNSGIWCIGFSVPPVIELMKRRHDAEAERIRSATTEGRSLHRLVRGFVLKIAHGSY